MSVRSDTNADGTAGLGSAAWASLGVTMGRQKLRVSEPFSVLRGRPFGTRLSIALAPEGSPPALGRVLVSDPQTGVPSRGRRPVLGLNRCRPRSAHTQITVCLW